MFQADYTPPPGAAAPGGGAGGSGGDDRQNAEGDLGEDGGEEELGEPEPATLPDGTPNPDAGKRKRYKLKLDHIPIFCVLHQSISNTN